MSGWETMQPGKPVNTVGLKEGEVSLSCKGKLTIRAAELEEVGIKDWALVLFDTQSFRIAVRAPHGDEVERRVRVGMVKRGGKDSGRRAINVARAIRELSLEPAKIAGRFEALCKGDPGAKDALLIVPLISTKTPGQKPEK